MQFTMVINMDNEAFQNVNDKDVTDATELLAILDRFKNNHIHGDNHILVGERRRLLDSNGNTVGYFEVTE